MSSNDWRRQLDLGSSVHLMGAGGMGMAGLAALLYARGLKVSGCDRNSEGTTVCSLTKSIVVLRAIR